MYRKFPLPELSIISVLLLCHRTKCAAGGAPLRKTAYGMLRGKYVVTAMNNEAEVFFGIPYAAPPVGELRFKKSAPLQAWSPSVRQATAHPPFCIQFWYEHSDSIRHGRQQSEDCLYMNLIAPRKPTGSKLYPVLVWIHGGSYQVGGANTFPINETIDQLVARGIIVVFVNYRLGALGFLSSMSKECPGNYGLEDQIAALKWLQQNIQNFGGNPDNITLAGESAGAAAVSILAISPRTRGLISQAIVRSGSSLSPWAVRSRSTDSNSLTIARLVNCIDDRAKSFNVTVQVMDCLRKTPVNELVDVWRHIAADDVSSLFEANHTPMNGNHPSMAHTFFTPVVDSYMHNESIIPIYPKKLMSSNARVPLLIGTTTAECTGFVAWLAHAEAEQNRTKMDSALFGDQLSHIVPEIMYANYELTKAAVNRAYIDLKALSGSYNKFSTYIQIASDQQFVVPSALEAQTYASAGLPVFAYSFDYEHTLLNRRYHLDGTSHQFETGGAPHGYDNVFLFRNAGVLDSDIPDIPFSADDEKLSSFLAETIANFVKYGDPNDESDKKTWPRFRGEFGETLFMSEEGNKVIGWLNDKFYFWRDTIPMIEALPSQRRTNYIPVHRECSDDEQIRKLKMSFFVVLAICVVVIILLAAVAVSYLCGWCRLFLLYRRKISRSDFKMVATYDEHMNNQLGHRDSDYSSIDHHTTESLGLTISQTTSTTNEQSEQFKQSETLPKVV